LAPIALLACGGRSSETGVHSAGEGSGQVELRVIDGIGNPVPSTPVLVDGAIVTTDADGRATSAGVVASYDIAIVVGGNAYVALGMTTRSPTLKLLDMTLPELSSTATVEVDADSSDTQRVLPILGTPDVPADEQVVSLGYSESGRRTAGATWRGSADVELSVEAVVAELDVTGNVVGYSDYAEQSFEASPGDELAWQPDFGPVPFDTVPIHVDTDVDVEGRTVFLASVIHESSGAIGFSSYGSNAGSGDLLVLDIPGARYQVTAELQTSRDNALSGEVVAEFLTQQRDVEAGASIHLVTGPFTLSTAPDAGSLIDPDTTFSWTAGEGAINLLEVVADDAEGPRMEYEIATTDQSAELPDLTPLGFAFPSGRKLWWLVTSEYGDASVDTYVAGERSGRFGYTVARQVTAR
jgi:hypothetical protein